MGYDTEIGRFASNWSCGQSHVFVWVWYAVALGAAIATVFGLQGRFEDVKYETLLLAALADLVATLVIWVSAILVNNSSMYDPYWSVVPPVVVIYWGVTAVSSGKDVPAVRIVLCVFSAWIWAIRLTSNWIRDWPGLHHEDFRYIRIRESFRAVGLPKALYWLGGSLAAVMLVPTVWVFLGSVPLYAAVSSGVVEDNATSLNAGDFIATFICIGAAGLQFVADEQMRRFRAESHPPGTVMHSGLWRYSRHPNYFGEIMFWLGLYVHALATDASSFWWTGLGFLVILFLFCFASVPLMEKRMLERRPAYKEVIRTTSMLIPMCPKS